MHITFVVLHYLTLDDTVECVESILNINYDKFSIVIVDNGSTNSSGIILKEKYKDNNLVNIIISEENLGFAKGNNIGYRYAKYSQNADFIILINNDTVIKQIDFCDKLVNDFKGYKFDIAGPKIISLVDKKNQNPVPKIFYNKVQVKKFIRKFKLLLIMNYIGVDSVFENLIKKVKGKNEKYNKEVEDIQLHGSCIIFSKNYIDKYDGLYDKTFMYMEECILKYISDRDNLKMKYLDNITIYHKEDSSTNVFLKNNLRKRRFYYKNSLESCNLLLGLMNKGE
ncbi:glycosyltransferase [Clostridium perfringens]|nr:glycosyltransferase [Clostridium perfringens]